jgi:hypothetical protein
MNSTALNACFQGMIQSRAFKMIFERTRELLHRIEVRERRPPSWPLLMSGGPCRPETPTTLRLRKAMRAIVNPALGRPGPGVVSDPGMCSSSLRGNLACAQK